MVLLNIFLSLKCASIIRKYVFQVWLIIIPYGLALHLFWTSGYRRYLLYAAIPLWILIGFYVYYLLDELAVPVYLFLAVTIGLGYSEAAPQPKAAAAASRPGMVRQASSATEHIIVHKVMVPEEIASTRQTVVKPVYDAEQEVSSIIR